MSHRNPARDSQPMSNSTQRSFRRRIGEILVSDGIVGQDQVDEALAIQKRTHEPLGVILLDMGAVSESDIAKTICVQFQLPFISLGNYELDEKLALTLPAHFLHQNKLIPFDRVAGMALTAVSEVPDDAVLSEITRLTKSGIALYVSFTSDITRVLDRVCPIEKTQNESGGDEENGEGAAGDENTLVFGKGSFLEELDSTWDTIFEGGPEGKKDGEKG